MPQEPLAAGVDHVVPRVISRNSIAGFGRHGVSIGAKDPADIVGSLRSKFCNHVTIHFPISSRTIGAEFLGSAAPVVMSEIHLVRESYKHQLPKLATLPRKLFQIEIIFPSGNELCGNRLLTLFRIYGHRFPGQHGQGADRLDCT